MTAFHYRADLRSRDGMSAIYGFTPYDMMSEVEPGEFRVDASTWSFEVLNEPRHDGAALGYAERCIPALVVEIRKHFDDTNDFPAQVCFVA